MLEMFALKVKSVPAVGIIVEQSMPTAEAVIVKVLVFVLPVAELAAKVAVGGVASTLMLAVTFKMLVAGSPEVWLPYSITLPELK